MNDPGLSSSINKILHPVNLRTTRASSNETASKWTKSWYRLPFCQTLSLKPPTYTSNHGFRSSEWWDIMRCPMVSMEEIAHLRNAHMLPTTMNQRSPPACVWQRPWQFHFTATADQNTLPRRKGSHIAVPVSGWVFIPHSQTNSLSKLKMTRKLCISRNSVEKTAKQTFV